MALMDGVVDSVNFYVVGGIVSAVAAEIVLLVGNPGQVNHLETILVAVRLKVNSREKTNI